MHTESRNGPEGTVAECPGPGQAYRICYSFYRSERMPHAELSGESETGDGVTKEKPCNRPESPEPQVSLRSGKAARA